MTDHTCKTLDPNCYRCQLNEDEMKSDTNEPDLVRAMKDALSRIPRLSEAGRVRVDPIMVALARACNERDLLRADLREAVALLQVARGKFQSYEECDQDYCHDGLDHEPRARMDALLAKHKETP